VIAPLGIRLGGREYVVEIVSVYVGSVVWRVQLADACIHLVQRLMVAGKGQPGELRDRGERVPFVDEWTESYRSGALATRLGRHS
jgi:hypothetical protein